MKRGDLVKITDDGDGMFTVGNMNMNAAGFAIPAGSIALVLEISDHLNLQHVHILVDGKLGWIYPEDGEVIDEAR